MRCPALGRRTAHHNLIVRISDGAVVDRYQESIDLARHLLGKQRSLRMRLPMFAAIGKAALRGQSQKELLDALSRPAQQDALSADQSWARRRQISSAASLNCYRTPGQCRGGQIRGPLENSPIDDHQGHCSVRPLGFPRTGALDRLTLDRLRREAGSAIDALCGDG